MTGYHPLRNALLRKACHDLKLGSEDRIRHIQLAIPDVFGDTQQTQERVYKLLAEARRLHEEKQLLESQAVLHGLVDEQHRIMTGDTN